MKEILNTAKMFEDIRVKLAMPDWLEYASFKDGEDLYDTEFEIHANASFGASEGIYVDFYIEGEYTLDEETHTKRVGVMKTLREDEDAFREISALMTEMLLMARKWQREHKNELLRKGFRCSLGKASFIVYSRDRAKEYFSQGYSVTDLETMEVWEAKLCSN